MCPAAPAPRQDGASLEEGGRRLLRAAWELGDKPSKGLRPRATARLIKRGGGRGDGPSRPARATRPSGASPSPSQRPGMGPAQGQARARDADAFAANGRATPNLN